VGVGREKGSKGPRAASARALQVAGTVKGARVSQLDVPDGVLNAAEEGGLVRMTKRQIIVPLLCPN
jgi:hypothetical protein